MAPVDELGVQNKWIENAFVAVNCISTPCRRTQKTQNGIETPQSPRIRTARAVAEPRKPRTGLKRLAGDLDRLPDRRSQNPENPERD